MAITDKRRGVSSVQSIESAMSRIWRGKDGGWMEIGMNADNEKREARLLPWSSVGIFAEVSH
ncbi:hypothetical protein [Bradyrhizobium sp. LA6.12]|uniref:hypothetical protein n=1 Tax=unclassified Bradyrhizobium TaxID=2631580 RepID=UPI00339352EE